MPEIVLLVDIAATPAAIFPLIGEAAAFGQWWPPEAALRWHGLKATPGTSARWVCTSSGDWLRSRLLFELQPTGTGVDLWLLYSSPGDANASWCRRSATLGALLFRIKAVAESPSLQIASASQTANRSRSPRAARGWRAPQSRQGAA